MTQDDFRKVIKIETEIQLPDDLNDLSFFA